MAREKCCPTCNEVKPIAEFGRNRQAPDGLHYYCRVCAALRQKAWVAKNPTKVAAARKKYIQKIHALNETLNPYAALAA